MSDAPSRVGPSPGTPSLRSGVPGYCGIGVLAGRPVAGFVVCMMHPMCLGMVMADVRQDVDYLVTGYTGV